jgi:hypothetical protein
MKIPKKINSVSGVIELVNAEVYLTVNGKKYKIKALTDTLK